MPDASSKKIISAKSNGGVYILKGLKTGKKTVKTNICL